MKLQVIKAINGKAEYVLLPISVYQSLKEEIEDEIAALKSSDNDYVPFDPADYVDNPVALARIKAHMTQEELAKKMGVTQAYISKLEKQDRVTVKVVERVHSALGKIKLHMAQEEPVKRMHIWQAYISKPENQKVLVHTPKALKKKVKK